MEILVQIFQMVEGVKRQGNTPIEILVPYRRMRELVEACRADYRKKKSPVLLVGQESQNFNEVGVSALFDVPLHVGLGNEIMIRSRIGSLNPFGNPTKEAGLPTRIG